MALETVEHAVTALVALYDGALDDYMHWQRRVRQDNHYRTRDRRSPPAQGGCALSTSLRYSAARIRDTFANGTDVLGSDFAAGDKPCFRLLLNNLGHLEARVDGLRRHARGGGPPAAAAPLELREALLASEAVRAATLRALAEQYHRVAVGRLASPRPVRWPATPPAAAVRPGEGRGEPRRGRTTDENEEKGDDEDDGTEARRGGRAPWPPSPPSPPPTPTQQLPLRPLLLLPPPDDAQSTCTAGTGPRPRASVFSLFCPEAVKCQVDLTRAAPRGPCRRCGYAWAADKGRDRDRDRGRPVPPAALKDGFQLTARFLGKSHCGGGAFACVLCTSRGDTALYTTVAALRDHLNLAHDKWQMLHERDLSAR